MKKIIAVIILCIAVNFQSAAIDKKAIKDVDTDALTKETQVSPKGSSSDHMSLAWWIPNEFWDAILTQDETTSRADNQSVLDAMDGISLLAIVQADITSFGSFKFFSKDEVENTMEISFQDEKEGSFKLTPLKNINPDLEIVLGVFKPILSAAMGNLGSSMHFYVLNDKAPDSSRLVDPYAKGLLKIRLKDHSWNTMEAVIELPLNSLFIPRKCPNGKDAHVSWNFCPWTGKKLEE